MKYVIVVDGKVISESTSAQEINSELIMMQVIRPDAEFRAYQDVTDSVLNGTKKTYGIAFRSKMCAYWFVVIREHIFNGETVYAEMVFHI